jgi:hypothetical protein
MKADILQQAQLNWSMQLFEFIINMFTDEDNRETAIKIFRDFASYSHLVATYNALVASTEKKIQVATHV